MRFLFAAIACVLFAPASYGAEPIASLPYSIDYEGWITIEATVNGKGPYDFVIDTGSTLTLAFENLASEQAFAPTGQPPRRILGITGGGALDTYYLGDIEIGPIALRDHIGVILPVWAPPRRTPHGLIGLDFLRQYALHFDPDAQMLHIYAHGGVPKKITDGLSKISLKRDNFGSASGALFTSRGIVNRSPTTFIIDLGSASTLINYEAAEALFSSVVTRDTGEGFTTGSRLKDVFDDRTRARTAKVNRIQLGRVRWRNRGVWVYNAPLFDEVGTQRLAYGLFGADLLAEREFALDFGENELYVQQRR